jgi:hypothetical protein
MKHNTAYIRKLDFLSPNRIFDKNINFGSSYWDKHGNIRPFPKDVPTYKKLYIVEREGPNRFRIIQVVPLDDFTEGTH